MENRVIKKYFLIDSKVVRLNSSYPFDIYISNEHGVQLVLNREEKVLANNISLFNKKLYISSSHKDYYTSYLKTFTFLEDKKKVFKDASKSIEKIFSNPELLASHQEIRPVVNSLMEVIFEDDFTMAIVFELLNYDYYTHTHSLNVTVLSLSLGKKLNLTKNDLENLGTSALLHDIGKSKVDKKILNKKGPLTAKEFSEMKKHTQYGYDFAWAIGIRDKSILAGIKSHHEKMDGTGYPDALKASEIHIFSKIIGICDIFDALISDRVYKSALGIFDSFLLIKREMQNKLDMKVLDQFILLLKEEGKS